MLEVDVRSTVVFFSPEETKSIVLEDELALEDTVHARLDSGMVDAEQWNMVETSLGNHRGRFKVS